MAKAKAARRYAKALFSLAHEDGRAAEMREELERLGRLLAESAEPCSGPSRSASARARCCATSCRS
jgi:F0F1-type ATP synthase delta subunit